ncbi:MAG: pilus assembly PilX N-terminal domain-containing protein [Acidimicrobiales bacterium]
MLSKFRISRLRGGDEGSVILAMTVVMVATFAILGTLVAVTNGLELARNDQNRTNAFQHANAGIDQAMFRLDTKTMPTVATGTYTPTVVGGEVVSFTETVSTAGSSFVVNATQDPPGQPTKWKVRATGNDPSGRRRQAIATITATPIFANGFFTDRTFYLTGNQDAPVAYDSTTCPTAAVACELPKPIPARLGTNATVEGSTATTGAFIGNWQGFNMYGRADQASADAACDSGRCGTSPKVAAIPNRLPIRVPAVPAGAVSCPTGGTIGAPAVTTLIEPGDYACNNLNLQGTIVVGTGGNGTGIVRFWVDGTFSAGSTAVINRQKQTKKFQVYQQQSPGGGSICSAEIWGLLYTPGLEIDCTGSAQPKMYGSVVANLHGGTGNHFDFHWDASSQYSVNDGLFVIKNWRECPPSVTDC